MKSDREQTIRIIRKVKKSHGGHHGGAWKVAFADFMCSMMALFLVLWLITQSSEVRIAIAGYFQDPLGRSDQFGNSLINGSESSSAVPGTNPMSSKSSGDRSQLIQLSQQIQAALSASPDLGSLKDHVAIEMTPEGLRISLLEDSSDVFFASGSAKPFPRAERLFSAIGGLLGAASLPIVIEGHTDAHQYTNGAAGYDNWNLSSDRAETSRRLLMQGGLQEQQIAGMRGLADRDPRVQGNPFAPQNRRVTILVTNPAQAAASATPPPPPPPANGDLMIGHGTPSPRP